jgi:hypothetical protein
MQTSGDETVRNIRDYSNPGSNKEYFPRLSYNDCDVCVLDSLNSLIQTRRTIRWILGTVARKFWIVFRHTSWVNSVPLVELLSSFI